jgi:tRNA-splicing endonuclease subunit Sen34
MARSVEPPAPTLPFPAFRISSKIDRYLLYDIDTITWLRKTHHILGVLIGTLPQIPQQNVFLGLPLELMPEEARLLCEKNIAYVVEDLELHNDGLRNMSFNEKEVFRRDLERKGREAARVSQRKKVDSMERAMRRLHMGTNDEKRVAISPEDEDLVNTDHHDSEIIFGSPASRGDTASIADSEITTTDLWKITPTTSYPPLPIPPNLNSTPPDVNLSSYHLFKHLHDKGYYMSPGLRFGCQFLVYPGDPLRFHSHFLAVGMDWDEEINLLDIVVGGRLGTGVKKSWLIGGPVNMIKKGDATSAKKNIESESSGHEVRTFCIEWGGM